VLLTPYSCPAPVVPLLLYPCPAPVVLRTLYPCPYLDIVVRRCRLLPSGVKN
jgi:hypothetical protein